MADIDLKDKAMKIGTELLLGYINSLGADITNRFLFGGKGEVEDVLNKVNELIAAGKPEEAKAAASTLQGKMSAIGQTDEEMIFQDLMEIRRMELITTRQSRETAEFLAGLTPDQRRRIRKGNMAESNPDVRQNKFVAFATCRDNDERIAQLQAAGYFDPSELERLQAWDQNTFAYHALVAENDANLILTEFEARHPRQPRQPRGFFGWLNPFN